MGKLPSLRIDHIFTDPVFEVLQTTRGKALLSDHQAVVADIRLPQKE
jgi:endonuclease/exonuclease/phosphatase family metal-dependent hydrolase